SGRMVWTALTRVDEGEAALWAAYQLASVERPKSVADLLGAYSAAEDGLLKLRPKTQSEYRGAIERHLLPEFGRSKPADVTQMRIARFLDKLGTVAANRAVATLSSAYSWA